MVVKSSIPATSPVAQLLDAGNLVVKDKDDNEEENFLRQSFDYPGDTLLPGMKYVVNLATSLNRGLTSWKSDDDPSEVDYMNKL